MSKPDKEVKRVGGSEVVLVVAYSRVHSSGYLDSGASSGQQAMPTMLTAASHLSAR
jgi:hypothetical protein